MIERAIIHASGPQQAVRAVALYRFDPRDDTIADDFFATDVMAAFAPVMVIGGDSPVDCVDLKVFVAWPVVEWNHVRVLKSSRNLDALRRHKWQTIKCAHIKSKQTYETAAQSVQRHRLPALSPLHCTA